MIEPLSDIKLLYGNFPIQTLSSIVSDCFMYRLSVEGIVEIENARIVAFLNKISPNVDEHEDT